MNLSEISLYNSARVRIDLSGRSIGLFCRELPGRVDRTVVTELKEIAGRYPDKNVRLCLHDGPEAAFHDMIIFDRRNSYYAPHRHPTKAECWHVVEGAMAAFVFGPQGTVLDAQRLEADGTFLYRIDINMVHTVMPLTEYVIYHESKPGPFLPEGDSIVPEWAPDGRDVQARDCFVKGLMACLTPA